MALYWPEAKFALERTERHEEAPSEKYPPDVLVISVREEQVADPEFLEEMRELVIRRTERFAAKGEKGSGRPHAEAGIPSVSDIFESLVADEADGHDGCDLDEGSLEDCLGHALEIGYGLATSGAPQVQLVINGCRDVIVRPSEVAD